MANLISNGAKMKKLIIVLMILSVFQIVDCANANPVEKKDPTLLAILKTKDGDEYQVRQIYTLSHGFATYTFKFGQGEDLQTIYYGENFGDGEKCPTDQFKENIILDKAMLKELHLKKDFNADMIDDFDLSIIERDCKTGELTFIEKILLSNERGFEIKTVISKGYKE